MAPYIGAVVAEMNNSLGHPKRAKGRKMAGNKWFGAVLIGLLLLPAGNAVGGKANNGLLIAHGQVLPQKRVAMTFDDGPNEPYTSQILDILRQEDVRATFFMIGKNVEAFPDAARKVADAGHEIGNHSYSHYHLAFKTKARAEKELISAEQAIFNATGRRTRLFRPPYGKGRLPFLRRAEELGYASVRWSVSARDWRKLNPMVIKNHVLKFADNGTIVLMHDGAGIKPGGDRNRTVHALYFIIRDLKVQGYQFVTVSELLKPDVALISSKKRNHV